jgi:DNA polymerase epsilon subunit 3
MVASPSRYAPTPGRESCPSHSSADPVPEDLSMPRTIVQRLARGPLPPNSMIQKDAITALAKGATVFISHVADQ